MRTLTATSSKLTNTALITGSVALFMGVDYYNLYTANDLTEFGRTITPLVIGVCLAVCLIAITARLLAYSKRK